MADMTKYRLEETLQWLRGVNKNNPWCYTVTVLPDNFWTCHMSFQKDGPKGSWYKAYVKSDFPSWQQKYFPIPPPWLENKVQCHDHSWSPLQIVKGYTLGKLIEVLISNVLSKQTVQLFGWINQENSLIFAEILPTTSHLAYELEKEKQCYHPCWLSETEGIWRIPFLPWRETLFHSGQVSWGQGHGLTPPTGSQLRVLWPKRAFPAFPIWPFKNMWTAAVGRARMWDHSPLAVSKKGHLQCSLEFIFRR